MGFWGIPINVQAALTDPVDNDRSTVETIHQMIAIARVSTSSTQVINVVDSILRSLPKRSNQADLVRAIYWWVKNHVTFREDEETLTQQMGYVDPYQELLISPPVLLSMPQPMGDCDDYSMLIASMMLAVKVPVWFKTIAVDPETPNKWSHVYTKVYLSDEHKFMMLDASHGKYPGWETNKRKFREAEWFVG